MSDRLFIHGKLLRIVKDTEKYKWHEGNCWYCEKPAEGYFSNPIQGKDGREDIVVVYASCRCCAMNDVAIIDAESNGLRFTSVSCAVNPNGWDGARRCYCGRASILKLGHCIECSKTHRFLSKAESQAKAFKNLLKELNREIREKTKG